MNNQHVALMMGGATAEREVSLKSGHAVHQALTQLGHQVTPVNDIKALQGIDKKSVDVVFNILHGADGEDGQLAAWLNLEGYVSTCCDFAGTCMSWHKDQAKAVALCAGLLTPKGQLLHHANELIVSGTGPWIVKPATEGSSVGLFKANTVAELEHAVTSAFNVAQSILVEEFIQGTECTVGIVGDVILPVVSIVPSNGLYDYQAKYQSSQTQYHCPANFSDQWQKDLQSDAKKIYDVMNINGWCRVDFIIDEQGRRWFLEVNTTPGMTNNSLLPKAAAVYGWEFKQLVAAILATANGGDENE
ncbi:MAG: D-alanine--D-alanine ligase family protein [Marinicella sp.]